PANEVFATLAGQTRDIILPDGTQATLGAGSKLEMSLSDRERRAVLHWGTVFFSVEPEPHRPFVVRSGAASVRVLGTAFDLQRREDKLYVQVAEGEVEVALPMRTRQGDTAGEWVRRDGDVLTKRLLNAGDSLIASKARGLEAVSSVAIDDIGAWRDGRLVYLQTPVSEVISDVNRYTDDPIAVHESIAGMTLSATFSSQDIEGLLVSLQAVLPVKISQQDGSRYLVPDESR
ncbi:MAG: FecR domain-containing protein, partial [Pseudomonadota bacterium]